MAKHSQKIYSIEKKEHQAITKISKAYRQVRSSSSSDFETKTNRKMEKQWRERENWGSGTRERRGATRVVANVSI